MNRNLAAAFVLLVSLGHSVSTFAVDFASPVSYPVGMSPVGIAIADFNGDGKPDIAVANSGSGNVSIMLGNGDGTFQAAVNFDAVMASPSSVAVADFNGDGKPDLAVFQPGDPQNSVPGAVSVLLGNGDGTFQTAKTLAMTSSAVAMLVADFNLDGKSDLAVMDLSIGTSVFFGNGDGTFQPAKQTSVPSGALLVQGDFNGDGKPDLALASGSGITPFLGKGDGTFQAGPTVVDAGGFIVHGVQSGDVNGDGRVDFVVWSGIGSGSCIIFPHQLSCLASAGKVSLFVGTGSGSFQDEQILVSASTRISISRFPLRVKRGSEIGGLVLADFNGDGKSDVAYAVTSYPNKTSSLLLTLGKGDGSFSPILVVGAGRSITAVADLNSDKNSDLVVAGSGSDIGVALNTSPTSGADLGIISAGASTQTAGLGLDLTYTANVLNLGPKDATGVKFTDTLPNGVSFVSASATPGSCIQSRGIVACDIGSLASAFDASVTIVVTPIATGTITNNMDVTAAEQDLVSINNTATQSTTVVPIFSLTVAKAGSGSGTVTSNQTGIDCGTSCSAAFLSGTAVSLTAAPSGSSSFVGWSGACTGTDPNSCAVTLNSNLSVTATFTIPPDFSVDPTATSLIVKRGGEVSEVLNFSAQGGFAGTIALACSVSSGPSPMPTCGISPASVTPGTSATLTVNAAALSASLTAPWLEQATRLCAAWLPLGLLGCILATGFHQKWRRHRTLGLLMLVGTILAAGCSSGSSNPPPPQNYTVAVTATSGAVQHSTTVSVTVN